MEIKAIIRVRIKKADSPGMPYWYKNHIGEMFYVYFNPDSGMQRVNNGWAAGVFQLAQGYNPGKYNETNNAIRPEDVRVVV